MKWLTIWSVLVLALLKIQKVESRGVYEDVDGGRSEFEIRRSLVDSVQSRVSSPQDHQADVSEHKPSDFDIKRKNKYKKKRFKRSLTQHLLKKTEVEFMNLSRNEQIAGLNSYAVRGPIKSTTSHSHLISLSTAVMLIVVLVICLHAPCTCLMRKRHKSNLEVDLIGCPNPTAHKGRCGKCIFDRASKNYASRYRVTTKSTYSSSSATKEELFLSPDYQPPWMTDSSKGPSTNLPNPKKSKSIVQAILKRSRDRDKFRYEFLASKYGYDYQTFRNSSKRSSIYDEQDPDWYSPGEFLNNQSSFRGQKNYGSTDSNKMNAGSYCQWSRDARGSRDSGKSTKHSVEDLIQLQPKRRQVVELKDFPLGYSESYAGVDVKDKENDLFDPIHDNKHPCQHAGIAHGSFAMSESNLDMYFSRMEKKNPTSHSAEDGVKPCKGRGKHRPTSPKSGAKIVQFYPTSFDYNTKFVQNNRKSKSSKDRDWLDDSDFDDDVSSDEVLSFDEADEHQLKQDFLYSPHMQGYRQCHHYHHCYPDYYPALLRYPDVPRHTTRPPREYKTRMRRDVARSESELRRSSGVFGNRLPHDGHSKRGNHVSSSDTSLHRMQIENELASVGLAKPKKKKTKEHKMTVRDNRLEPLAGIMSPMRPLENCKTTRACDNIANDLYLKQNTKAEMGADQSYVVKLPPLQPSYKEDLECKITHPEHDINISIKGTKRDQQLESNYRRNPIELNPHYIKNSYFREEPVRDTDSDDAAENIAPNLPSHCRVATGNEGKTREEGFPSARSTTL